MTVIARPLLALAATLALAGCATPPLHPDAAPDARLSTEQFPVTVTEGRQEMLLAVHDQGLSPNQRSALAGLAADWQGGPVNVQAPGGEAGRRAAEAARTVLASHGVPPSEVVVSAYDAPGADAPLRIDFVKRGLDLPRCGEQWANLTSTAQNRVPTNFGCATSANMAAQIADPNDLLGPRAMDPADAGRRSVVLDKYRKGEVTSAAKGETDGYVSDAVK